MKVNYLYLNKSIFSSCIIRDIYSFCSIRIIIPCNQTLTFWFYSFCISGILLSLTCFNGPLIFDGSGVTCKMIKWLVLLNSHFFVREHFFVGQNFGTHCLKLESINSVFLYTTLCNVFKFIELWILSKGYVH